MLWKIFRLIGELGGFAYAVVTITRAVVYWCGGPVNRISPFSKKEVGEVIEEDRKRKAGQF